MQEGYTDDLRRVTDVVAPQDYTASVIAQGAEEIIAQGQKSKIQANASAAQLGLAQLTQDYQVKNQSDPYGGLDGFKQQRQSLLDSYGSQISPFYKSEWDDTTRQISENNDAGIQTWGLKQTRVNSQVNMNSSVRDTMRLANVNGQQLGTGNGDLTSMLNYSDAKQRLYDYGNEHLGEETTKESLMNFDKDYLKSFVSGVAQTNPQRAAQILNDPSVADKLTTQERDEMISMTRITQRQNNINQSMQLTGGTGDLTEILNDQNKNYFQKRLTIDQMELNGQVPTKTASLARRVLTSQKNVDSVTDSSLMGNIVTQIYDLNSNAGTNNSDYLKGVQDIQHQVLEAQDNGKLNVLDAQKLNNQIRTLTSAKVASATNAVGSSFQDANKLFQTLPPEMRGEATRQLFYQTTSDNTPQTPQQSLTAAQGIVDKMNAQRRQNALQVVNQAQQVPTPDDLNFVKTKGYSQADVTETAQKYGISEAQVIQRLRAKK